MRLITRPRAIAALALSLAAAAQAATPLFVLNSLDADISVVDPVSFREIKRIPTGKQPHHLYLTPDNKSFVVANALGDSLTFLDPQTAEVQRVLRGISDPYHLRFSPDMKWFVTAGNRLNYVSLYHWVPSDANSPIQLVKRIPAPKTPSHLNIDSKSSVVYASLQDSDQLMAIDLATQAPRWEIKVGHQPADLFLSPDDKTLFLALTGDDKVEVYDVAGAAPRLIKRITTGLGAHSFRNVGDHRHVLVSNRAGNTISKIDMQSLAVVDTYIAPSGPDDMEILPDGHTLIFTSRWAGKLTQLDMNTHRIVRQLKVGRSPHGVWTLDHEPRL